MVHLELCEAYRDTESETRERERKTAREAETDKIRSNALDHRYFLTPNRRKKNVIFPFTQ